MATEYGNRLRIARKKAGLTQIELSKATGIAQSTISTAEREGYGSGETPVYAKVCGVSALWLATGEGPMEPATATANITIPGITVTATGSNQAPALMGRADAAINTEASQQQAVDLISSVMDMMDDAQREAMAGKLASWACAPDSPKIKKSIAESLASASKPKNITND